MSAFTRLTLTRDSIRVDVVVASDQPLGALMPRFCDLLGLAAGSGPYALVRPIGDCLDMSGTCEDNNLADGEIVYAVDWADIPAPPAVTEVTNLVAELHSELPGAWNATVKRGVASGMIAVSCLLAGQMIPWGRLSDRWHIGVMIGSIVLLVATSVPVGRAVSRWAAITLCAAAAGLCVPAGLQLAQVLPNTGSISGDVLAIMVLMWFVAGVGVGWGLRRPSAVMGALTCGVIAAVGLVLLSRGLGPFNMWGIVGIAAVLVIGLAPAWALSASGVTGLDDHANSGETVARDRVKRSVSDTYAMVVWCVTGMTMLVAAAAVALAGFSGNRWSIGLAGALVLVMALRTRGLPLAVPVGAMWAAVLIGVFALLTQVTPWWMFGGLALAALTAAVVPVLSPPDHVQVRLRNWGNILETFALVATLPLLLGQFGLYDHLLGAFK